MKKYIFISLGLILILSSIVYATNVVQVQVQPVQVVQQRQVNFSAETFLGTSGYYTYGQKLQAQAQEDNEALVTELKEQNKILKDLVDLLSKGASLPPANENPPVPEPPQDKYSVLEREVFNIFKESCVKCHGEATADGGLVLIKDNKLNDIALTDGVLIHHRVNGINLNKDEGEVRMPKGSVPLDTDKVESIRLWLVEKAKKEK